MKQSIIASCILALFMAIGCNQQPLPPTEVAVSLDYSFMESGSMTKAGDAVYSDFYEKYVKSKVLTPKTFNLTFTNVETKAVATIRGDWTKSHTFKLPTGEYEVVGTSHPAKQSLDSLYLTFNENVVISNETTSINLTANYDSYLLMFDASDKSSVKYSPGFSSNSIIEPELKTVDTIRYAFLRELWKTTSGKDTYAYDIIIIKRGTLSSTIQIDKIPFEKGKYYYFNDLSNSFDIPPMTSGN